MARERENCRTAKAKTQPTCKGMTLAIGKNKNCHFTNYYEIFPVPANVSGFCRLKSVLMPLSFPAWRPFLSTNLNGSFAFIFSIFPTFSAKLHMRNHRDGSPAECHWAVICHSPALPPAPCFGILQIQRTQDHSTFYERNPSVCGIASALLALSQATLCSHRCSATENIICPVIAGRELSWVKIPGILWHRLLPKDEFKSVKLREGSQSL